MVNLVDIQCALVVNVYSVVGGSVSNYHLG